MKKNIKKVPPGREKAAKYSPADAEAKKQAKAALRADETEPKSVKELAERLKKIEIILGV